MTPVEKLNAEKERVIQQCGYSMAISPPMARQGC